MTLHVKRDGQAITFGGNVGLDVHVAAGRVSDWSVSEYLGHLRWFWGELGRQLDEAEAEAKAASGA